MRERENEHLDPGQEIVGIQRRQLVDRVQHEEAVAIVLVEQVNQRLHTLGHERRTLGSQVQKKGGCGKDHRAVDRLQLTRSCLQQSDQIGVHFISGSFIRSFTRSFVRGFVRLFLGSFFRLFFRLFRLALAVGVGFLFVSVES